MSYILKNGIIYFLVVGMSVFLSGCETVNQAFSQKEVKEKPPYVTEAEPAMVIEPYDERPSQWKPILPHELDAHIEEMEILLSLLRYSRRLTGLNSNELEQEYRRLSEATAKEYSINEYMKLALLLSNPNTPYVDYERAKRLLSEVLNKEQERAPVLREYAYSVIVTLEQDKKMSQRNTALRKKLKQEIDRRQQAEKQRDDLAQTRKQLEEKLEALKSIEETITQRQNEPEEEIAP
jgi:hypothetical protein